MKRVLSVFLCFVLLFALAVPADALTGLDDGEMDTADFLFSISWEDCSVRSGDAFTVKLIIRNNAVSTAFSSAVLRFSFDTAKMTIDSVSSGLFEGELSPDGKDFLLTMTRTGDCTENGVALTLHGTAGSTHGDVPVLLYVQQAFSSAGDAVHMVAGDGNVNIICQHEFIYSYTNAATCFRDGEVVYTCKFCGEIKTTVLEKTDHVGGNWVTTKQPTCTAEGKRALLCRTCSKVMQEEILPATGHSETVWRVVTPAGCTEGGEAVRMCPSCGVVFEHNTINATGHIYSYVTVKEPTCVQMGISHSVCLCCGKAEDGKPDIELPKTSHHSGEWVETVAPTCTAYGTREKHCIDCGTLVESEEIPMLSHRASALCVTKAPTTVLEGGGVITCLTCGKIMETVTIPAATVSIGAENTYVRRNEQVKIPITVSGNSDLYAGLITFSYNTAEMIYDGITVGLAKDITVGSKEAGSVTVLFGAEDAITEDVTITENGTLFTLNFTLTAGTTDAAIEAVTSPYGEYCNSKVEKIYPSLFGGKIRVYDEYETDTPVRLGESALNENDAYCLAFDYFYGESVSTMPIMSLFTDGANFSTDSAIKNENIYTLKPLDSGETGHATVFFTAENGLSESYLYVLFSGDANVVRVLHLTLKPVENLAACGVSVLSETAETETGRQALRYYFSYATKSGGADIVLDGQTYTVASRGFLYGKGTSLTALENTSARLTCDNVDSGAAQGFFTSVVHSFDQEKRLTDCWSCTQGESFDTVTFSAYFTDMNVRDDRKVAVRAFVTLTDGNGNCFTLYSETVNSSVREIKDAT